jgi:hypothetical protein
VRLRSSAVDVTGGDDDSRCLSMWVIVDHVPVLGIVGHTHELDRLVHEEAGRDHQRTAKYELGAMIN